MIKLLLVPADVILELDEDQSSAGAAGGPATATDAVDPSPAITQSDVVDSDCTTSPATCTTQTVKEITRTWKAEDASGNFATSPQDVEVKDTKDPLTQVNPNGGAAIANNKADGSGIAVPNNAALFTKSNEIRVPFVTSDPGKTGANDGIGVEITECRLDGTLPGDYVDCTTSPYTKTGIPDGPHRYCSRSCML